MDPLRLAGEFVAERFPRAQIAIVAGSTARGTRTATSDIDLLLIGADMFDAETNSLAATYAHAGEVFEVFAYTPEAFGEWAASGVARFRPTIVDMLVNGSAVHDDGSLAAVRDRWRQVLDAGADPSPAQLAMRRYVVTDVLDDLADATDPLEAHVLMHTLFREVSELALLANRRWIGAGKHLPRRLRDWDPARASALADPYLSGDRAAFLAAAARELEAAGGRLQAGHVR
ncbi:nucleotidyltransferase domain-containing protein [Microbacterium karelineae]|uniref:nucleotidyltransferase domain-containing protein n=1 Tax=Microbacterium karelineae TaxID=2654283 RepID=UPI0012EA5673|nr:nucleotidyltransferase domain-containing protein [Microbacterium karelineae]